MFRPVRCCGKCHEPSTKLEMGLCPPCKKSFDEWEKAGTPAKAGSTLRDAKRRPARQKQGEGDG